MRALVAGSLVALSGAAALLINSAGGAPASFSAPASSSAMPMLGVYAGSTGSPGIARFVAWQGAPVHWLTQYLTASRTWGPIDDPHWYIARVSPATARVVWSVPILNDPSDTLQSGAAGRYNQHFLNMARAMVADGQANAVFRLGWEFGGSDMPWSAAAAPAAYAEYWRQMVTTMRSVPGQRFQFDWNGGGGSDWDVTQAYPGDQYVDYVTADVYDQSWDGAARYRDNLATPNGYLVAWRDMLTELNWMAGFAADHHKLMGITEWGVTRRQDGHGGGDNPYFIKQMFTWMTTHHVAYEIYFNDDAPDGQHDLSNGNFPQAAAEYRALFGK